MAEQYHEISSDNNQLSAILHAATGNIGVLIIVGGPQYRIGSHRQFVKLSRHLASQHIPSMRLDSTGMGDSSGQKQSFYQQTTDINAGITAMFQQLPQLKQVVLWGLCDAASAILLKMNQTDPRIAGLILLNPWVRQQHSHAETLLKHYYLKRLISRSFWRKVFSGGLAFQRTLTDLRQTWHSSKQPPTLNPIHAAEYNETNYVHHMLKGWQATQLDTLLISSGQDLTAQEFLHLCQHDSAWQKCFNRAKQVHLADANHTFSTSQWRNQVEQACSDFVSALQSK
jgi:uncharacterized protein